MYRVNQPSKKWGLEKKNDVILHSGSRRGGYTKSGAGGGGSGRASKEKLHVKFVQPLFVTIWRSGTSLNHCKRFQECYMC